LASVTVYYRPTACRELAAEFLQIVWRMPNFQSF